MANLNQSRKPVFTAIANVVELSGGGKRLSLHSIAHWRQQVSKLLPNKKYAVTVEEYKATRSRAQLAYYWVILGYLADYSGHTSEELHDAIMRQLFGTKTISIGGIRQEVRKSISDSARFSKADMVQLIDFAFNLARQCEVRIPTKEELGYL